MSEQDKEHSDFIDAFYKAFEDRFRGSRQLIKERFTAYGPFLSATLELRTPAHAIDLGCGRGEWLEILREGGFEATGVDLNDAMLADCRELGLDVRHENALTALRELSSNSQSIVSGFHIAEHLEFSDLLLLMREALRVLVPGGLLILETPNPDNIRVATNSFYFDPTHRNPLPSELLAFAVDYCGFARLKVLRFREESEAGGGDVQLAELLNGVSRDYAVVAQKRAGEQIMSRADRAFEATHGVTFEELSLRHKRQIREQADARSEQIGQLYQKWHEHDFEMEHARRVVDLAKTALEAKASAFEEAATDLKAVTGSLQSTITSLQTSSAEQKEREHRDRIANLTFQFQRTSAANAELHKQIELFRNSTSWRLMAPMRWIVRRVRSLKSGGDRPQTPALGTPTSNGVRPPPQALQEAVDRYPVEPRFTKLALRRLEAFRRVDAPEKAAREGRLRLAYFSPLPPQQSGISDYSVELLPALAKHYDIDAIVEDGSGVTAKEGLHCSVRSVSWFQEHAGEYDRILYHVGNSPFHAYMLPLIEKYPGVVVLHDFYLGNLLHFLEHRGQPGYWTAAVLYSHGYKALRDSVVDSASSAYKYPANRFILENAQGVIVHSEHARQLPCDFYQKEWSARWSVVPSLKSVPVVVDRIAARRSLGIDENDFVVCSFGLIGPTKLNHQLLEAWAISSLASDKRCRLTFVGEAPAIDYCSNLRQAIAGAEFAGRVRLTDFAPRELYEKYLAAADVAVQLRTLSRGETSAAVRDCMGYGLPVIVNAHGAMAELPGNAVVMLPDEFSTGELRDAIERLKVEPSYRASLANTARDYAEQHWSPSQAAKLYADAIEQFVEAAPPLFDAGALRSRAVELAEKGGALPRAGDLVRESRIRPAKRQLLVDVTVVARDDFKTGIQRVVRSQLMELLKNPPSGFQVEPIRLTDVRGKWEYMYARDYAARLLHIPRQGDEAVEVFENDIVLVSDFYTSGVVAAAGQGIYSDWRSRGATVSFIVYDVLPLSIPHRFPPSAEAEHREWLLRAAENADRLIGISAAVARATREWLSRYKPELLPHLDVTYVHLGADIDASAPTAGLPAEASASLETIAARPSFVMVGTVEPRKGYLDALAAFERLWREGVDVNLVIVGSEGWTGLPDKDRRTIPEIVGAINQSPELGKRLIWLKSVSDEYLGKIYAASSCLLAASEDEGFGLPLVEAARHRVPVLARDIAVFREVGGDNVAYFQGGAQDLAGAIKEWLGSYARNKHPKSDKMRWLTWADSVDKLKSILLDEGKTASSSQVEPTVEAALSPKP